MYINMRFTLLSLAAWAFVLAQASLDVDVMPSKIQSRSFNTTPTLINVTRYEFVHSSSASTRDLDLTPHGPTGVSTYLENEKRQNLVAAGVWATIAGGFASSLTASCSIAGVLTFGGACGLNLVLFFFFLAGAAINYWVPTNRRSLLSDIVWTLDPQYVPTVNSSILSNLAAAAPRNKFTTFGNVTTDGNFYHLAYYHHGNETFRGLRITRNATLSSPASVQKRQTQGDLPDSPGDDYSAYVYWGNPNQAASEEWAADFDNAADNEGFATAYADWVFDNDAPIACMDLSLSNYAGNELVSVWYWDDVPGTENQAPPDEVESLMDLCNTI